MKRTRRDFYVSPRAVALVAALVVWLVIVFVVSCSVVGG